MTEKNRMTNVLPTNGTEAPEEPKKKKKKKLSEEQSLAAHLIQEREKRQKGILEMNELLKEIDAQAAKIVELKRSLYQERLNAIAKDNADLRTKYDLPDGKAQYVIEDGAMYVLEADVTPDQ
ncbi:MAG: hypothetical protein ACXABY_18870 [Candidatus Thorarchaeota archaeon]|jgi:hypothetical protein